MGVSKLIINLIASRCERGGPRAISKARGRGRGHRRSEQNIHLNPADPPLPSQAQPWSERSAGSVSSVCPARTQALHLQHHMSRDRRTTLAPFNGSIDYKTLDAPLTQPQRRLLVAYQNLLECVNDLNRDLGALCEKPARSLSTLHDIESKLGLVHTTLKTSVFTVDMKNKGSPPFSARRLSSPFNEW